MEFDERIIDSSVIISVTIRRRKQGKISEIKEFEEISNDTSIKIREMVQISKQIKLTEVVNFSKKVLIEVY